MRERRWESETALTFEQIMALGERLARRGLQWPAPSKELICYIEEWTVKAPGEIGRLAPWDAEDVTLIQIHDGWRGDFYLTAANYHALYRQWHMHGAYCSVSHPFRINEGPAAGAFSTHHPQGMFWVGFRDTHAFIRVRLHTTEVITPGETRADGQRELWLEERERAFQSAIDTLALPIDLSVENERVIVRGRDERAALLCSWPDAFGPCQFEFNIADPFELLVRAGRLAATSPAPAQVRAYLTGFSVDALTEFEAKMPPTRAAYRCSIHCRTEEIPELFRLIGPDGRLYATLCEFQTDALLPEGENAWVILGVVGQQERFRIEARLNRAPLPEARMDGWLTELVGAPMSYAPLGPFP